MDMYRVIRDSEAATEENGLAKLMVDGIVKGNIEICRQLILGGYNLNSSLSYSTLLGYLDYRWNLHATALHVACIYRRPDVINLFLECGADPNIRDWLGRTALHLTSDYWPHLFYTEASSGRYGDVSFQDYLKRLHQVSATCLELLCTYGADVNAFVNAPHRETALHLAAKENFTLAVGVFIKHGINLELTDPYGRTPLIVAAQHESVDIIQELILCNSRITARDNHGSTALHLACRGNNPELQKGIQLMLDRGAKINQQNLDGNTPLHFAASAGNEAVIDLLLGYGADPDILNHDLQSALFMLLNKMAHIEKKFAIQRLVSESSRIRIRNAADDIPRLLYLPEMNDLKQLLFTLSSQLPSLQNRCRHLIRRTIGLRNLKPNCLEEIVYPNCLKDYIIKDDTSIVNLYL